MTRRSHQLRTLTAPPRPARPRRGSAYLLVLSAGMLMSVIGLGILTAGRTASRVAGQEADLTEASLLAEGGVEWGMAAVAANTGWRSAYTSGVEATARAVGRGTVTFKLVDETDGNLSNNASDAVRVYGVGRVGAATRVYSVLLTGTGASLDVLKSTAHGGSGLTVTENVTLTGGPLSANGTLTVNGGKTVTGDVQATALSVSGTVSGSKTTLSSALPMPDGTAFDTYKAAATVIAYPSGGGINKKVLSPGTNTISSSLAANGVYYVAVPAGGTLSVTNSRLVATLVVELGANAKFVTTGTFAWDPPRADYPALVVKGTSGSTVTIGGSNSTLNESSAATNFNPDPTPYPYVGGTANTTKTDTYPAELHGLVHLVGAGMTTSLSTNLTFKGCVLADGAVTIGTGVRLTADPTLATSPPSGYTVATTMTPTAGSWRWDAAP